jgi:hypothetical protein
MRLIFFLGGLSDRSVESGRFQTHPDTFKVSLG